MRESRELTPLADHDAGERLVERAFEAAAGGSRGGRISTAVEALIDAAEADVARARTALWSLRRDRVSLERLEECLGGSRPQATLALGAAIQLAHSELASPTPNLRTRLPELLRWLQGDW